MYTRIAHERRVAGKFLNQYDRDVAFFPRNYRVSFGRS